MLGVVSSSSVVLRELWRALQAERITERVERGLTDAVCHVVRAVLERTRYHALQIRLWRSEEFPSCGGCGNVSERARGSKAPGAARISPYNPSVSKLGRIVDVELAVEVLVVRSLDV